MSSAEHLFDTAVGLFRQGQIDPSLHFLKQTLNANPRHAEAHYLLGSLLLRKEQYPEALSNLLQATRLEKKRYEYFNNLGNAYFCLDQLAEAKKAFQQAIRLNPQAAEPFNNLGRTLREQEDLKGAQAALERATALDKQYIEAWNNLASVYYDLDLPSKANAAVQKALQLDPVYYKALINQALILELDDRLEEAEQKYREAIAVNPNDAEGYNNLGAVLTNLGKPEEGLQQLRLAIEHNPAHFVANHNMAFANFELGHIGDAWDFNESRWRPGKRMVIGKRHQHLPLLTPQDDLKNAKVLVWREQGIGDELSFASILPDAQETFKQCVMECTSRWQTLFERSFPGVEFFPQQSPEHPRAKSPEFTHQTPICSLARIFRRNLEAFPCKKGFLVPDPERVQHWHDYLASLGTKPKIGIAWRSQLRTEARDQHYLIVEELIHLLKIPNATFINLQYDECSKELALAKQLSGVTIHQAPNLDLKNDLEGNAALTSCLDLVISSFNSVAEIAGAVGVPTFAFGYGPGLWATLGTDYVPWFPSLKYYSRRRGEDWNRILGLISRDVEDFLHTRSTQ